MDDSSSGEYLSADEGLEESKLLGDDVCSEGAPDYSSVVSKSCRPIIGAKDPPATHAAKDPPATHAAKDPPATHAAKDPPATHVSLLTEQESPVAPANTAQNGYLMCEESPVPPPRTKRKKKYAKSSLENLSEVQEERPHTHSRSLTFCCTDPRKELDPPCISSLDSEDTPERDAGEEEACVTCLSSSSEPRISLVPLRTVFRCGQLTRNEQRGRHRLVHTAVLQDKSRSTTPTPAICIEPELEWTTVMLSGPEREVVTSDTSLAKAKGPTITPNVLFPSDDESVDGAEEEEELGFAESEQADEDVVNLTKNQGGDHGQPAGQASPAADSDNQAILDTTMVTNLDTGEVIPLSAAEQRIPQGHDWSPLSEHLIRRTKEIAEAEGHLTSLYEDDDAPHQRKTRKMAFRLKKWGKRKERVLGDGGGGLEVATMYEDLGAGVAVAEDRFTVKYKQSSHKQGDQEFDRVRLKQDLTGTHMGAIWCMEFSICGRLLATAGQDSVVRVWVLATASHFFHELQAQYQRLGVYSSVDSLSEKASVASGSSKSSEEDDVLGEKLPFQEHPLCSYCGHTADVLDLSWSKNFFLLSSSMDKTVRLWHISRKECLCCFQHVDFVTAIAFHPRDDRYFLSGSLDGKLRLWNIPDKRVALWNEIEGVGSHLITAASFCMNGKLAVVGTYDGRCIFFDTEHLKYHTQIHVKSRHGKNKGRKISGVEPLPGEDKLLVTSNDSRVRLYNLKDHELSCKYKGYLNTSSQIKATFSRDGQYIISGSEDNFIYIWRTHFDLNKLSSARRDRNEFYESFTSHSAPITTAVFAPVPGITVDEGIKEVGEMVVAADYQGCIKVYVSGETL